MRTARCTSNKTSLAAFEAKRDLAAELIQSIQEMKAGIVHPVAVHASSDCSGEDGVQSSSENTKT